MPDSATHHLVLQDDVELCDDFVDRLDEAAAHIDEPICLFSEWGSTTATSVRWAALSGHAAAQCVDTYTPTQGVLLSRDDVNGLVRFAEARSWDDPDDIVLREYLGSSGRSAFALSPNLLQHDGGSDSLMHNEQMGPRRSTLQPLGDTPPGDGILALDGWVPTCTWSKGRGLCVRYDAASLSAVDAVPTRRLLQDLGHDTEAITAAVIRHLEEAHGPVDLELAIGFALLHEVWFTAVALALLSPAEPTAGEEATRYALSTVAPGALRKFVDLSILEQAADQLTELVVAGFRDGLALRT